MALKGNEMDKSSLIPLFYQLKTLLLDQIKKGEYKIGELIPTEAELSNMFEISRTTVRQAIVELVKEGWLYRVKGKGTYVSKPKIEQSFVKKIESFNDQIERLGMVPSTEVLEMSVIVPESRVAEQLGLGKDEQAVFLFRKRMANGEPIVTIKTYLPYRLCAFVLKHDLEKERLYKILGEKTETAVFRIERKIEAVEATKEDASLLNIKPKKPVQYFESTGYNVYDTPIEFSIARYRGDRNRFEVTVFPE